MRESLGVYSAQAVARAALLHCAKTERARAFPAGVETRVVQPRWPDALAMADADDLLLLMMGTIVRFTAPKPPKSRYTK